MNIVYMAVNCRNGKRYIGVTRRPLHTRRMQHFRRATAKADHGMRFHAAIRKYGREVFVWTILACYPTYIEALAGEVAFIASLRPEYNVCKGGIGGPDTPVNRKAVVCIQTGERYESVTCAARAIGIGVSTMSQACQPNKHLTAKGFYFRFVDEMPIGADLSIITAEIRRVDAAHRRRGGNRDNTVTRERTGRPVICTTDGLRYPSASAAARAYDLPKSAIIELCLGKNFRRFVGGLHFSY